MQYEYSINVGNIGEFILYDIAGDEISRYRLSEGDGNILKISDAALKNGVYFYRTIINGQVEDKNKIVIIK